MFCFCGQGEYGEMIACDSPICPVEWFHLDCLGCPVLQRVNDFDKNVLLMAIFAREKSEHLRTLVSGQLPQGQGNLLIFAIRFASNPRLVPGWGVYIDSCITHTPACLSILLSRTCKLGLCLHINFLALISEMFGLSLLASTLVVVQSTQQCRSTSVRGRYLKDHVILSENVKKIGMCYIQCSMNQRCKSINFHFGDLLCELNDADRYTHPWDYVLKEEQAYSEYPVKVCVPFSVQISNKLRL